MDEMDESFNKVFSVLSKDQFFQKPESILSYMRDAGFRKPIIKALETIIELDRRRFTLSITCPDEEKDLLIQKMSEDSFINEKILSGIISCIRSSIRDDFDTELVDHPKYGRCRSTFDGTAIYDEKLTKLIHVDEHVESFIIPKSVVCIGHYAFNNCKILKDVVIPSSVTRIEYDAFSNCISLKEIVIPDSINHLSGNPFSNCPNITIHIGNRDVSSNDNIYVINNCLFEIDYCHPFGEEERLITGYGLIKNGKCAIPDSVGIIGESAFCGSDTLTEIKFPRNLVKIEDFAFNNCISLETVEIPDSVRTIGYWAFCYCDSLKEVFVPDHANVAEEAFYECPCLKSASVPADFDNDRIFQRTTELVRRAATSLPETIYTQGDGCLLTSDGVGSITKDLNVLISVSKGATCFEIPEPVRIIGDGAFDKCGSIEKVTMPDSVIIIGFNAFDGCKSLRDLTISKSLKIIEDNAFSDCSSLKKIAIPKEVVKIGAGAFSFCPDLSIHIGDDGRTINGRYYVKNNCLFESTNESIDDNMMIGYGLIGEGQVVIPDHVQTIGYCAFAGSLSLKSVSISDTVTIIDVAAFYGCSSLEKVEMSHSVTEIRDSAFYGCSSLVKIEIPDSVKSIGQGVFYGCDSLIQAIIPDDLVIGDHFFPDQTKIIRRLRNRGNVS